MKRTPLKRRTPLRTRRKPARVIEADLWRAGLGPCVVCGTRYDVDAHHVVPKGTLKRLGHTDKILDIRNRVGLCRHHHEAHHSRFAPLGRDLLPASVFEFADELGLGWYVDRHYGPGRAVQATLEEIETL